MTSTLIVDGANVVGSRPDGWWRDRAGAAARLHTSLLRTETGSDRVILVLEGKARPGVEAGIDGVVQTVHARTDGDSTIVALCDELIGQGPVAVVTADRGLSEAVLSRGAEVRRPSWLLDRLGSP